MAITFLLSTERLWWFLAVTAAAGTHEYCRHIPHWHCLKTKVTRASAVVHFEFPQQSSSSLVSVNFHIARTVLEKRS